MYMMNILDRINFLGLFIGSFLCFFSCSDKKYKAVVIVSPSSEECDDYNVIWDIDSVL